MGHDIVMWGSGVITGAVISWMAGHAAETRLRWFNGPWTAGAFGLIAYFGAHGLLK